MQTRVLLKIKRKRPHQNIGHCITGINSESTPTALSTTNEKPRDDSIFGTSSIEVSCAGYGTFVGYFDHCLSWVDINWESALGIFQKIQRPLACRLQYYDPQTVRKYPEILQSLLDSADIVDMVLNFEDGATLPREEAALYKELDGIVTKRMTKAKTSVGNYTWEE